jgi:hypothetical protein
MRARQLIGCSEFPPHELATILEGFEDAWAEIRPEAGSDPFVMETARVRLAEIVLAVAGTGQITRGAINVKAVSAFRARYRIEED